MALEKIGPYEFLSVVGRGGMGSVYRSRHSETGEIHAVKVLAQNFTDEEHFRNRFESEIRALIKLDHPNIVRILSYGQEMGNLYFAMELVEGKSLFQLQKKGHRFDWREILSLGKQVAKGLRHAHDRGIIHRDLKPGNLLQPIDADGNRGEIKITDFGIAKRYGTSLNTGENVLGTMDFMSPEQAKGQPVTIRSDLYSLGTVMYTLLSGRPPFSGNSVEESLRNLTRVPAPKISSVVPEVPKEVDNLIQKLMDKRPEHRVATAQALLHKIEDIEASLFESSKAKTFESRANPKSDDTFDVAIPAEIATHVNTDEKKKRSAISAPSSAPATVDSSEDEDSETESSSSGRRIDYYNTVTDQIRQQQERELTDELPSRHHGFWLILLALMAVIGIAAAGIYQATKPRPVEELYAEIVARQSQPQLMMDEIDQFLKHYADDSRADEIEELQGIGSAVRFYNRLTNKLNIRANLPGESRLTEIEKQFLDIVELSQQDRRLAATKMSALITVYRGDELSDRDSQCIAAAKNYRIKIQIDAHHESVEKLKKIQSLMDSAGRSTGPESEIEVYHAILQLFKDEKWDDSPEGIEGQKLVEEAQRIFDDLVKNSKPESTDVE